MLLYINNVFSLYFEFEFCTFFSAAQLHWILRFPHLSNSTLTPASVMLLRHLFKPKLHLLSK